MKLSITAQIGSAMKGGRSGADKHARAFKQAMISAMVRGAKSGITQARREVSGASGIKQKTIKGRMGLSPKKRPRVPRVSIVFGYAPVPFEAFGNMRQTKRGVKSGRYMVPGGFVGTAAKGKVAGKHTAFKRLGKNFEPIFRLGVKLEKYLPYFRKGARGGFDGTYPKRLKHELDRRLKRAGLK